MGRKRKLQDEDEEEKEVDLPPAHLTTSHMRKQEKRLIVVLENAQLETAKLGQNYELLTGDDHAGFLKRHGRDPAECRPDIAHQCLLMLLDSPLNRAGLLQVYVHTAKGVLIEVNPQTRIPRTFKRFAGLMVQLLLKFSIRASDGPMKLLKVIRNPVTDHLPVGCRKLGTSVTSEKLTKPVDIPQDDGPVVIVVGAMAHGKVNVDYIEETISVSSYPLSGALACAKITGGFEEKWGIH
ncbi:unnamed protein product [Allacma fusca]|uniref:18S rRNA (pseudouridine-N1)-methyltransferase n=1 Tax=Allacma fusca TaxID=39272 RepID=A0A8J2PFQ9_9HEXA|nr:unnamed protein product [Allacma fusca]